MHSYTDRVPQDRVPPTQHLLHDQLVPHIQRNLYVRVMYVKECLNVYHQMIIHVSVQFQMAEGHAADAAALAAVEKARGSALTRLGDESNSVDSLQTSVESSYDADSTRVCVHVCTYVPSTVYVRHMSMHACVATTCTACSSSRHSPQLVHVSLLLCLFRGHCGARPSSSSAWVCASGRSTLGRHDTSVRALRLRALRLRALHFSILYFPGLMRPIRSMLT
jgi:hypothetical protein